MAAIGLFRVVNAIGVIAKQQTLSVFEAGPGCGYTGLMLALNGHAYTSYDVTQGTYIWQSLLFDHFFGSDFSEALLAGGSAQSARLLHVPWWQYATYFRDCRIRADVILSNANLAEMSPMSLKYLLRISRLMLSESNIGMIVFANVGGPHMNSEAGVEEEFERAGYRRVLAENIFAYVPKDMHINPGIVSILEDEIPQYDPSGRGGRLAPREVVNFADGAFPPEYDFWWFVENLERF